MIRSLFSAIKIFSIKERIIFVLAFVFFASSGIFLISTLIGKVTSSIPSYGGSFTEGVIGQPAFVNPILARHGTADADITRLTFASLYDLSESIKHDKNFKTWNVRIKESAQWEDETPITSDDIVFTVQTIQNPDSLSPYFSEWQNIKISRISEREVEFDVLSSYSLFENLLKDLRPVPKKVFADLSVANIRLSKYSLEPISSGPFKYQQLEKRDDGFITSYTLEKNATYKNIGKETYLNGLTFKFFANENDLVRSYNLGTIDGFLTSDYAIKDKIKINSLFSEVPTTKYYALFLNSSANSLLESKNIKQALKSSININDIIVKDFEGLAIVENGPIPPALSSYDRQLDGSFEYNSENAKQLLQSDGWTYDEASKSWVKENKNGVQQISFTIKVPDIDILKRAAQTIKNNWESIGIKTNISVFGSQAGENLIENRDYEILLFGNIVSQDADLFSFWHSNQKFYPGLNLSLYENSSVDNDITALRQIDTDSQSRQDKLDQIQEQITQDLPAIFLVSPKQIYVHKNNLNGINVPTISLAEDRFQNITDWYVRTKRILK